MATAQIIQIASLRARRTPTPGRAILPTGTYAKVLIDGQADVAYIITTLDQGGAKESLYFLEDALDSGRRLMSSHDPKPLGSYREIIGRNLHLYRRMKSMAPDVSRLAAIRAIQYLSGLGQITDGDLLVALDRARYSRALTAMTGRFRQFMAGVPA